MPEINRVLVDRAQDFTEAEKAQGRANIGAQAALSAGANITIDPSTNVISSTNSTYTAGDNIRINGTTISADVPEVAIKQYGAPTNTPISSLVLDADDPDGYVTVKADNGNVGSLVSGPYSTLLNSGVEGVGDSTHGIYIDTDGTFKQASASGTSVETTSSPYTTSTAQSRLSIYDPGSDFGSLIKDQSSNNIGFLLPKHYGQADLGKVPTVVSDSGYKIEWRDPTGGVPEITPMGHTTVYLSNQPEYLTMEANVAYWLETMTGGSFTVHLGTLSTTTIHNKIYLVGTQSNCVTMTIVYEDEAGQVQQLNFVYGDTQTDTVYALDVYSRKVTITNGNMSFDTTMCRVYDYPCQTRDYFTSDNNNIGLVVDYVEPL